MYSTWMGFGRGVGQGMVRVFFCAGSDTRTSGRLGFSKFCAKMDERRTSNGAMRCTSIHAISRGTTGASNDTSFFSLFFFPLSRRTQARNGRDHLHCTLAYRLRTNFKRNEKSTSPEENNCKLLNIKNRYLYERSVVSHIDFS